MASYLLHPCSRALTANLRGFEYMGRRVWAVCRRPGEGHAAQFAALIAPYGDVGALGVLGFAALAAKLPVGQIG